MKQFQIVLKNVYLPYVWLYFIIYYIPDDYENMSHQLREIGQLRDRVKIIESLCTCNIDQQFWYWDTWHI